MRVLLATDGSEDAGAAVRFLACLPFTSGSEIAVVAVTSDRLVPVGTPLFAPYSTNEVVQRLQEAEREAAQSAVNAAATELRREGVLVTPSIRTGQAAHQILEAAEEYGADLVVVGSQGLTGLEGFVLGSVARNVAKHARRPVLIGRAPQHGLHRVVLAVDGSEHADHATTFLARLPLPAETEIVVTHVVRPYAPPPAAFGDDTEEYWQALETVRGERLAAAERLARAAVSQLAAAGRHASMVLRDGDPTGEILELVGELQADLVVAGARGVSLIRGLLVGSVADRLLKSARGSVLIVH